jgi:toxin HigB-1
MIIMIKSFGNKLAEHLFHGFPSKETRRFPPVLHRLAIRKLTQLDVATRLDTLNVPLGNRLEALSGSLQGYHSVRINDQWRCCFIWTDEGPENVKIIDYH